LAMFKEDPASKRKFVVTVRRLKESASRAPAATIVIDTVPVASDCPVQHLPMAIGNPARAKVLRIRAILPRAPLGPTHQTGRVDRFVKWRIGEPSAGGVLSSCGTCGHGRAAADTTLSLTNSCTLRAQGCGLATRATLPAGTPSTHPRRR